MSHLVLVIDDNAMNLRLMSVVLRTAGYEVATASDADEARQALTRQTPQLILMDLQLPGVNGFILTREFKARDDLRGIPIVAVTAFAMHGDEARALQAGCDGYVTKPINTRTFAATLAPYLAGKRPPE